MTIGRARDDCGREPADVDDPGGIIYRSGDSFFSLYPAQFAGTAQHTLGALMVRDVEATVAELGDRSLVQLPPA